MTRWGNTLVRLDYGRQEKWIQFRGQVQICWQTHLVSKLHQAPCQRTWEGHFEQTLSVSWQLPSQQESLRPLENTLRHQSQKPLAQSSHAWMQEPEPELELEPTVFFHLLQKLPARYLAASCRQQELPSPAWQR
jgi:hypothetical protein